MGCYAGLTIDKMRALVISTKNQWSLSGEFMRNYVLLTGATGLLGQYLVRDLLRDGHRVAVLIRATKKQTAEERLEQIMQMWERDGDTQLQRPICLTGDLTSDNLGLSAEELAWTTENCTTMMHCAASLLSLIHI